MKPTQRLHISIKGKMKNYLYPVLALIRSKTLGLQTVSLTKADTGAVEMVLDGNTTNLWKMVNWSKNGYVFLLVEEIVFKFAELEIV